MTEELNKITDKIIGAAITVHRELGPGLLESAYEACLAYELTECKLIIERQKVLPIKYRGVRVDCGPYRPVGRKKDHNRTESYSEIRTDP